MICKCKYTHNILKSLKLCKKEILSNINTLSNNFKIKKDFHITDRIINMINLIKLNNQCNHMRTT